jgi:hypothetical protein
MTSLRNGRVGCWLHGLEARTYKALETIIWSMVWSWVLASWFAQAQHPLAEMKTYPRHSKSVEGNE